MSFWRLVGGWSKRRCNSIIYCLDWLLKIIRQSINNYNIKTTIVIIR